ncbi:unnamed protein product [Urochloa humidicola]
MRSAREQRCLLNIIIDGCFDLHARIPYGRAGMWPARVQYSPRTCLIKCVDLLTDQAKPWEARMILRGIEDASLSF